ncbi:MAG TPA: hypothetical protein VF158_02180 [Longimicrobiales bacterium]
MAHDTFEEVAIPVRRFEGFPKPALLLCVGLVVVGAAAFIAALVTDAERAWRAYLFNWLYFGSMAEGAVMLAVAVILARGLWARPVRRIALGFVAFLPIWYVLLFPLLFQGEAIFHWYHEELHGAKAAYLDIPFLVTRNIVLLAALVALSLAFAYWALRPDAGALRDEAPSWLKPLYARLSRGWRGQEAEEELAYRRLLVLGPVLALTWALALSVVAFDFVQSQDPHWFSTLIGPYFFMAGFLGGLAATIVFTVVYRSRLGLDEVIRAPQFHDLGKLLFAFCIFWAYLFWAQFIVIWYGMLPWEQSFLVERLGPPYDGIATLILFLIFVAPFFGLLGAAPKRTPPVLALFASLVLLGLWFERYILVYPSFYGGAETLPLGWQEVGTALAFAGLLIGAAVWFATRFPVVQLWQPAAEEALMLSTEEPPGTEAVTIE